MTIPSVGGVRGVFEIFIPGLFLLLNIVGIGMVTPGFAPREIEQIESLIDNPTVVIAATICFSYLLGVILRSLLVDAIDKAAGVLLSRSVSRRHPVDQQLIEHYEEAFPYLSWLKKEIKECLPETADSFYQRHWEPRPGRRHAKGFFHCWKMYIMSLDVQAAKEVSAAEALCRYMAETFYALLIISVLIILSIITKLLLDPSGITLHLVFLGCYLLALGIILRIFRFMRRKEVLTVFIACLINRQEIEKRLAASAKKKRARESVEAI